MTARAGHCIVLVIVPRTTYNVGDAGTGSSRGSCVPWLFRRFMRPIDRVDRAALLHGWGTKRKIVRWMVLASFVRALVVSLIRRRHHLIGPQPDAASNFQSNKLWRRILLLGAGGR